MDVRTVLMDYLASIKHLSKNTQVGYRQRLTVFAEWADASGVSLEQVNNRNVQRFLDWLRANHRPHKVGKTQLSTHTIADYVRNIWTFLYWCLDDEEYSQYVKRTLIKGVDASKETPWAYDVTHTLPSDLDRHDIPLNELNVAVEDVLLEL